MELFLEMRLFTPFLLATTAKLLDAIKAGCQQHTQYPNSTWNLFRLALLPVLMVHIACRSRAVLCSLQNTCSYANSLSDALSNPVGAMQAHCNQEQRKWTSD